MAEEEVKDTVTEPEGKEPEQVTQIETEDKGGKAAEGTETKAQEAEKKFTQDDVDKMIGDRLAREKKKMPAADKLKAFEEWEKAQQTEAEKAAEREKHYAQIESELTEAKHENAAIKAGVKADDVDYVLFKVGRMDGDFEDNLSAFLKENSKYTQTQNPEPSQTKVLDGKKHEQPPVVDKPERLTNKEREAMGLPKLKEDKE